MASASRSNSHLSTPLLTAAAAATTNRVVYAGDPVATQALSHLPNSSSSNAIRTSKYNVITFLPRNLFEQFRRLAYVYFLLLDIMNQFPALSVYGGFTSFLPLGVVVILTAVKDAYEDLRRHLSDAAVNKRTVSALDSDTQLFCPVQWRHLRPGDVVKLQSGDTLPCDLVLLATSHPSGMAFLNTSNLDGESNLKTRFALRETTSEVSPWKDAVVRCGSPNIDIYAFHGNIELPGGNTIPLGPANVALRGCEIKNTEWVVGVAVYTGMETKVMLNSAGPPSKRSRLETHMNREILILAAVMILLCSIVAMGTGIWLHNHRNHLDELPYFRKSDGKGGDYLYRGLAVEVVFAFMKSVLLFQNLIPLSLYISMELARLVQSFVMAADDSMWDKATGNRLQCRALNISEDLGQVKYVFSDKTGTLTENKMVFRRASVNGVDYSNAGVLIPGRNVPHPIVVDGQVWKPKMVVDTDPELVHLVESGRETEDGMCAYNFFLAIATCNTVVPQVVDTSDPMVKLIDYQGESPDEQALVYAAASYGFSLVERTSGHITFDILGERQRFDVLGLHEFDSDRKMMSIVIGCPDKRTRLFVKGADSAMSNLIEKTLNLGIVRATELHLHTYSSLGLRTLLVGMREFTGIEYHNWHSEYGKASTALSGRTELLRAIALKVECNLQLLGASGVEDKLQEGVPEAIESLRQAGIKVWVLTGDKMETAISIGYSSKLLTDDMTRIIVNGDSDESCRKSLMDASLMSRKLIAVPAERECIEGGQGLERNRLALIIDGPTLVYILETDLEEELFKLAAICHAVLCCRVAPLQKAGIVALVKKRTNDLTLSVGDGANDVSMIQMADVGIGISGQEGQQAVMASDFAIGQFQFLVPLLLVHGHWNYWRLAYMILYNFYRNALNIFPIFWYQFFSCFSGSSPITDVNTLLFGAVYTALPTIAVGVCDQDLSRNTLLKYPQLYGTGMRDESYNLKLFALTMMDGIWQSLVVFCIPFFAYRHGTLDDSTLGDLWMLSMVLLVNLHLAMDVMQWNWIIFVVICGLTILTFSCVVALDASPTLPGFRAANHLMDSYLFWLIMLCILVSAFLPRFTAKVFDGFLRPNDIKIAREREMFGEGRDSSSEPLQEPQ